MIQLIKGMFNRQPREIVYPRFFGMRGGQMRPGHGDCYVCGESIFLRTSLCKCSPKPIRPTCHKMGHNNSWYNNQGEKLGWGDICSCDLNRIIKEMDPSNTFYCLYEGDGYWDIDSELDLSVPGITYVQDKAHLAVHKKLIYNITNETSNKRALGKTTVDGIELNVVHRSDFISSAKETI